MPMLVATLLVVVLAAGIAAGVAWMLGVIVFGPLDSQHPWIPGRASGDEGWLAPIKVSLTVAAGVGAAVALVVAYRKQKVAERHEARQIGDEHRAEAAAERERERAYTDQYRAAVEQLGHSNATVRLAGVYALAALADAWDARRQQCIGVLCAHLRTPWQPPRQGEPLLGAVQQQITDADGTIVTRTYPDQSGEWEVRNAILRVIGAHLRPDGRRQSGHQSWSDVPLDLAGAHLPGPAWTDCLIPPLDADNATFLGSTQFAASTFTGQTRFVGATFMGYIWAGYATFAAEAWFRGMSTLNDALFLGVTFGGTAQFEQVTFGRLAVFDETNFVSEAKFGAAEFKGKTSFDKATFSGNVEFAGATFGSAPAFAEVNFKDVVPTELLRFVEESSGRAASPRGVVRLN